MTDKSAKIALVTGASRGLGAAMAEELAGDHHVVAVARTTGALEELDDRIRASGGAATLAPMDITMSDAMAQLARSIFDRWGKVDIWVHAAIHAAPLAPAAHLDEKDLEKSLGVNVQATAQLIAMIEPLLKLAPQGRAVFFDDPRSGEKFFGHYGASKAAQISLARSWQSENASIGPKVHIVTPAPMPTATRARFFPGEDRTALTEPRAEAQRLLGDLA